jgi:hypothetical protein
MMCVILKQHEWLFNLTQIRNKFIKKSINFVHRIFKILFEMSLNLKTLFDLQLLIIYLISFFWMRDFVSATIKR